jgi:hypothetical protein
MTYNIRVKGIMTNFYYECVMEKGKVLEFEI